MSAFRGITRLVAEGFRGATSRLEMVFQPRQPFVLLFGENGAGKSSVADAIEFAIQGTKGSLGDLSSTGLGDLVTLGTPAPPLLVELQAGGETWQARLRKGRHERSGPAAVPRVEILRRSRLSKIVAATPKERFDQLAGFVDVEPVYEAELSLERAMKDARGRRDEAAQRLTDAQAELDAAWAAVDRPGTTAEAWARGLAGAHRNEALTVSRQWLEEAARALDRLAAARVHAAQTRAEAALAAAHSVSALAETGETEPAEGDRRYLMLLMAAQDAVAKAEELIACPVCEQPVEREALRRAIDARLGLLREETERLERRHTASEALRVSEAVAARAEQDLGQALGDLAKAIADPPSSVSAELVTQLATLAAGLPAVEGPPLTDGGPAPVERLATAMSELRQQEDAQRQREAERAALLRLVERIASLASEAQTMQNDSDRLGRCLEVVRSTRKAFTERVLSGVEGEMNRLYEELHPGEGLGPVRLRLDPNRRASLLQSADYGEAEDLAPQACFSESHLLTLALCLWLALAKRDRPEETILVLDDVIFAVDAPHTKRIAAMLAAEASGFAQVVVTTHSRRFLRYLRSGVAASDQLDCRTLRWSLRGGIVHGASASDAERLAVAVAEPILDRQGVASQAGVLLEAILRQLAALYRRRVPFGEPTEPDLGELINAWSVPNAEKVHVERRGGDGWADVGTFGAVFRRIHDNRDIRNLVGAHLNTEGDEVPDAEVLAFGLAVQELWRLLACPQCGQIPSRPKDDLFVCHCKKTRMRPNRID